MEDTNYWFLITKYAFYFVLIAGLTIFFIWDKAVLPGLRLFVQIVMVASIFAMPCLLIMSFITWLFAFGLIGQILFLPIAGFITYCLFSYNLIKHWP